MPYEQLKYKYAYKPAIYRQVKRNYVNTSKLYLAWLMNENAGSSVMDCSGQRHDAVMESGPTWSTGDSGTCINFPGVVPASNSIRCDLTGEAIHNPNSNPISMVIRVCPTYIDPTISHGVLFLSDGTGTGNTLQAYGICIRLGRWKAEGYGVASSPNTTGPFAVVNKWVTIALTTDGIGNSFLYIDGFLVGTSTRPPQSFVPASIQVGRFNSAFDSFTGKVDLIYIYNRQLMASEVMDLYLDRYKFIQSPSTYRNLAIYNPLKISAISANTIIPNIILHSILVVNQNPVNLDSRINNIVMQSSTNAIMVGITTINTTVHSFDNILSSLTIFPEAVQQSIILRSPSFSSQATLVCQNTINNYTVKNPSIVQTFMVGALGIYEDTRYITHNTNYTNYVTLVMNKTTQIRSS